jgi:hypothetical protein
LAGFVGLILVINEAPLIISVEIDPQEAIAFKSCTPVNITVRANDPDNNLIQRLFSKAALQYEFLLIGPEPNRPILHKKGPSTDPTFNMLVNPNDVGEDELVINVTDRPHDDKDIKNANAAYPLPVRLPNQLPKIEGIYVEGGSPQKINNRIEIRAKATDPENDMVYYQFFRMPPNSTSLSEIPPSSWTPSYTRFWIPNADDIGENEIIISARDGDKNGPYADHEPVYGEYLINVTGIKA